MSEYQYYEFQAIDRSLTDEQQQGLRRISSRAHITPTGFVNTYNYGDLHADPVALLGKYFDAFCYLANWGTRQLMFRIPIALIDEELVGKYCLDDIFSIRRKGEYLILELESESEEHEWEEGEGWLATMISLREDLIRGDFRCLYLAWLFGVQQELVDYAEHEPPVPAGLDDLNGALSAFIQFMRIDPDLVTVAARCSKRMHETGREQEIIKWVQGIDTAEKNDIILRLINGNEPHLGSELYQRFLRFRGTDETISTTVKRRTAGELLEQADACAKERLERETQEHARKQALLKKQNAARRKEYLESLAGREDELWLEVNALVSGKRPVDYNQALQLLLDLGELATNRSEKSLFNSRLEKLRWEHRRKYSMMKRLDKAGLSGN